MQPAKKSDAQANEDASSFARQAVDLAYHHGKFAEAAHLFLRGRASALPATLPVAGEQPASAGSGEVAAAALPCVFFSAIAAETEEYRAAFIRSFGHLFVPRWLAASEADEAFAGPYMDALRVLNILASDTLVLVMVSRNACASRRIDWDIAAALAAAGGPAGLLGLMLPEIPRRAQASLAPFFDYRDMPPRLADNVKSGYARIYDWAWLTADQVRVREALDDAWLAARDLKDRADNHRPPLINDLPSQPAVPPNERRKKQRRRG